jgi:RimJ/RimL family protein N-acetyltransferase
VDQAITSTDRLVVRQFVDGDASFLHDLHSRPEVFTPLEMGPSEGEAEELLRIHWYRDRFGLTGAFGIWALALLDGPLIGLVMLKPLRPLADHDGTEIGWRLHPDFWGSGYATEGAAGLLRLAFTDRHLSEVFAVIRTSNVRSRAVANRIGMEHVGTLDYAGLPHGLHRIDSEQWRHLNEDMAPIGS